MPTIVSPGAEEALFRTRCLKHQSENATRRGGESQQHTELIVIDGQKHTVKAGIFLTNHKSRRTKLTPKKLAAFAALGVEWATT
ncbi:hypothetical protein [[Kitasatospora] papulosa]|uniref:hypothetical protein n=1 Tax=[Kitasatospora] papulosa TaxID=1464011 RepID=UPI0036BEFBCE